jgi:hypothetical protein
LMPAEPEYIKNDEINISGFDGMHAGGKFELVSQPVSSIPVT